jgi:hypothetical protein
VGCLYGASFLVSQSPVTPVLAHSAANVASAFYWKNSRGQRPDGEDEGDEGYGEERQ